MFYDFSLTSIRGTLGSLINLLCNLGMLMELVLANYVSYATQAKIFLAMSALFVLLFQAFPESPDYLLSKDNIKVHLVSPEHVNIHLHDMTIHRRPRNHSNSMERTRK